MVRISDDGFGADLMCENFDQRGLRQIYWRTPSLAVWRPMRSQRRVLRTTLVKGVSGMPTGGPPLWQSDALWNPRGECFAPWGLHHSKEHQKSWGLVLGALLLGGGEGCEALSSHPEAVLTGNNVLDVEHVDI